jgi:cytochrome c553
MKILFGLTVALAVVPVAQAADIGAGKDLATAVCAACHGPNGVSVSDTIPNLAAQRGAYLEAQLKAFKEGTRKLPGAINPAALMNAVAKQLSADDIANVAAYFASLPGAATGVKSALLPNVATTKATFPEDYKHSFTKYHTINFPPVKQVRYYYANPVAVAAAKEHKPLPDGSVIFVEIYAAKLDANNNPITGPDGSYVTDKLVRYTTMAREAGWGKDIPEMLRNENWNYAIFNTEKQYQPGVNQAECLACHKPLDKVSYLFTLKELAEAK